MPKGIIIIGPGGSGKTTLGKRVAELLDISFIDIDDFIWKKDTKIPYTEMYSKEKKISRLMNEVNKYENFVMAGSMNSFHEYFDKFFKLAVYLECDINICLDRVDKRAQERMGDKIKIGGISYNNHQRFLSEVSRYNTDGSPNRKEHELWLNDLKTLCCKVISLCGEDSIEFNSKIVVEEYEKVL